MVECPKCHGTIEISEASFGALFTCHLCRGLFFVGWDGQPEINDQIDSQPIESQPIDSQPMDQTRDPFENQHHDQASNRPPPPSWTPPDQDFGNLSEPQSPASAVFEIERFANQDQETLPLSYDLNIGGLDLPKQIQLLREVLDDPRFGWDTEQILSQITQGVLLLRNLSPIKTSMLVHRIKSSNLEIKWRQNVLS
ncbi:MAG: zf-TFIIB domain-containing protein [Bdellovibrionaceae bacterium]|nr:zf-TFIIB domain-containing protein [Pseudobdellovibrionaceae bacterium]